MTSSGGVRQPRVSARPSVGFVPVTDGLRQTRAAVEGLEALGVDSLWASGHIASGRAVPEAMTGLCTLAALSERATVGTAVLLAPLYHPVIVAKQFAELDRATGGRVTLGIGVGGEYPAEFRACQTEVGDRGPRTDEAIRVVKALWAGGEVDNAGPAWPFEQVSISPPPVQHGGPPVIVAGRKDPAMRRAARLGDGWMPFLYSASRYAGSVERIREVAAAAGRDLEGFQWMAFVYVSLDDDRDTARRNAVAFIGAGQAGDGSRFETLVDKVAVCGDTDDVRRGLQDFVDAGARHLILMPTTRTDGLDTARTLMSEVVPALEVTTDADR